MLYIKIYKTLLLFFLWLHTWHVEVPRPGIEFELQLQPVLHLWQHQILWPTALGWGFNPRLHNDQSCWIWILNPLCHSWNSKIYETFWMNFYIRCTAWFKFLFLCFFLFCLSLSKWSINICWKIILHSLSCFDIVFKIPLAVLVWISFLILYAVLWIYVLSLS